MTFSDRFVKLLSIFHLEMKNGKNEFLNFLVLVLKVFNEVWLALRVLQTELLFPSKFFERYCGEFPYTIL